VGWSFNDSMARLVPPCKDGKMERSGNARSPERLRAFSIADLPNNRFARGGRRADDQPLPLRIPQALEISSRECA
jgi:hypothetical protein